MKYIQLFIIFIALSGSAFAQQKISLSEAIKKGLENNYKVKISKQKLNIAKNNNTWGAAGRYPTIDFNVNNRYQLTGYPGTENKPQVDPMRLNNNRNSLAPQLVMQWRLFDAFSIGYTKENFEQLEELAKNNRALDIEATIQGIVLAYHRALLNREQLSVRKELMVVSRDRFNYVKIKQDMGTAVTFDVLQAKNAYLRDSSQYLLQNITLKNSLRELNFLLGENATVAYDPSDNFETENKNYSLAELKQKMYKDNFTLNNLETSKQLSAIGLNRAKDSWYPRLNFSTGFDYSATNTSFSSEFRDNSSMYSNDFFVGLNFSINLYNGGNTERAIENAEVENEIADLQIREATLSFDNSLASLFEMYTLRQQLFNVAEANLEAAKLNMEIAKDKFESGTINSFNYRDVQQTYLNAAIERLRTIFDLIDTDTALLKITGGIISAY